jgi:hypothetical protein
MQFRYPVLQRGRKGEGRGFGFPKKEICEKLQNMLVGQYAETKIKSRTYLLGIIISMNLS